MKESQGTCSGGVRDDENSFRPPAGPVYNCEEMRPLDIGKGPTMSMFTWELRWGGIGISDGGRCGWEEVFASWQGTHSRAHKVTCWASFGHTKHDEMSRFVTRTPGWPASCRVAKMWRRNETGTRGRKIGVVT
jgi:hypothetical protein